MESTGQNWRHTGSKGTVDGTTIWHHDWTPTTHRQLEGTHTLCIYLSKGQAWSIEII